MFLDEDMLEQEEWVRCPLCKQKTRLKIRKDTIIKNYPLYCPKCKQKTLINIQKSKIILEKEPDAKTQSQ